MWNKFKDKDVVFIGVDVMDDRTNASEFIKNTGITYTNLYDQPGEVSSKYKVVALPATFFINKEGKIAIKNYGPVRRERRGKEIQAVYGGDSGVNPAEVQISWVIAFFAGVISFLSPCVLPLIPGYVSMVSKMSFEELTGETTEGKTGRILIPEPPLRARIFDCVRHAGRVRFLYRHIPSREQGASPQDLGSDNNTIRAFFDGHAQDPPAVQGEETILHGRQTGPRRHIFSRHRVRIRMDARA